MLLNNFSIYITVSDKELKNSDETNDNKSNDHSHITISKELETIIKKEFSETKNYSALDITEKILEYDHENTMDEKKEQILQKYSSKSGKKKHPSYWIDEVEGLYNPDKVHEIHIPEFILGMNLIDEDLKRSFNRNYLNDFRNRVLERNIKTKDGNIEQGYLLLTDSHRKLWDPVFPPSGYVTDVHRDAATSVDDLERAFCYGYSRAIETYKN
jgi:hypothetical protein